MEFTREKLRLIAGGWTSDIGPVGVQSLAEFAGVQLERAEKAEGWSLHWKGEAERLERELYLARFQHANREAPAEQNPELNPIATAIPPPEPWPSAGVLEKAISEAESELDPSFLRKRVALLKIDSSPQRPHESLVWALYHAVHTGGTVLDSRARLLADRDLDEWRRRWPEESE